MTTENERKTYNVSVPITGVIVVQVEAQTEEEAIDMAMASSELRLENVEEFDVHREVVKGNVFYGCLNEATAEEE